MEYPKRKHPRLDNYDYSLPGYYYATIHIRSSQSLLSHIEMNQDGLVVKLTALGMIARNQLLDLENRYLYVKVDKYVVMPTHIHAIFSLSGKEAERPGLTDIICAYKSLTTREVNQKLHTPGTRLFQTSFYETVLRNERSYQECWRYIDENPRKWMLKEDMPEFAP